MAVAALYEFVTRTMSLEPMLHIIIKDSESSNEQANQPERRHFGQVFGRPACKALLWLVAISGPRMRRHFCVAQSPG